MNPRDYKGQLVIHVPTETRFCVFGGKKTKGEDWHLKDALDNFYPLSECQLALNVDVARLQAFRQAKAFKQYCQQIGQERFAAAWRELNENPIDAAIASLYAGYCGTWQGFVALTNGYGVSSATEPEGSGLNRKFRDRLEADPALLKLVRAFKRQENRKQSKEFPTCTR